MSGQFRYPNIRGSTDREQLMEIKTFLRQLVDELNFSAGTTNKQFEQKEKTASEDQSGFTKKQIQKISAEIVSTVVLKADSWFGAQSPYSQKITVAGSEACHIVWLLPDKQMAETLWNSGTALTTENIDGVITVYAIGSKPEQDYTLQVSLSRFVSAK